MKIMIIIISFLLTSCSLQKDIWGIYSLGDIPREINVTYNSDDIINDDLLPMGGALVSTTTTPSLLIIQNKGYEELTIASITLTGADSSEFIMDTTGMSYNINPLSNTSFTVSFSPSTTGHKEAQIEIISDDSDEGTYIINLNGSAFSGVGYVDFSNTDPTPDGSATNPYKTITDALSAAAAGSAILVAQGTYNEKVDINKEVCLFGFYESSGWTRSKDYVTEIRDPDTGFSGTLASPHYAVRIAFQSRVEGFHIYGSSNDFSTAVFIDGVPCQLVMCRLEGGTTGNSLGLLVRNMPAGFIVGCEIIGGSGDITYGVYAENITGGINTVISFCGIYGGDSTTESYTFNNENSQFILAKSFIYGGSSMGMTTAILNLSSNIFIRNNIIYLGNTPNDSYGIQNNSSSPQIYNNTIAGLHTAAQNYGIRNSSTEIPDIKNNIIYITSGLTKYGIMGGNNATLQTTTRSNDIFVILDSGDDYIGTGFNQNIDPIFVSPHVDPNYADWNLTANSPVSVTEGGLDLSPTIVADYEGRIRSVPFSMGANEYD